MCYYFPFDAEIIRFFPFIRFPPTLRPGHRDLKPALETAPSLSETDHFCNECFQIVQQFRTSLYTLQRPWQVRLVDCHVTAPSLVGDSRKRPVHRRVPIYVTAAGRSRASSLSSTDPFSATAGAKRAGRTGRVRIVRDPPACALDTRQSCHQRTRREMDRRIVARVIR